jgi:tetratricopeptide (TPR) repeat protein
MPKGVTIMCSEHVPEIRWIVGQIKIACPFCEKVEEIPDTIGMIAQPDGIYAIPDKNNTAYCYKSPIILVDHIEDKLEVKSIIEQHSMTEIPYDSERWKEIEFQHTCQYCKKVSLRYIWGIGVLPTDEGKLIMVSHNDRKDIHEFPFLNIATAGADNAWVIGMPSMDVMPSKSALELMSVEASLVQDKARMLLTKYSDPEVIGQNRDEAYYQRSLAFGLEKRWDKALEELNAVIGLNPNYVKALVKRGLTNMILKQWDAVLADFNKAISIDPSYIPAYHNRGIYYYETSEIEAAIDDFKKVINNSNDKTLLEQANEYLRICQKSVTDFNECQYGKSLINKGQYEEAVTQFEKVIESSPENARAYFYLGMAYDHLEKYLPAIRALNKAIELDPESPGAHNNRGWVYLKIKQYQNAITDFTREIELNAMSESELAAVYCNRFVAYSNMELDDLALADLNNALERSDNPKQIEEIRRLINIMTTTPLYEWDPLPNQHPQNPKP